MKLELFPCDTVAADSGARTMGKLVITVDYSRGLWVDEWQQAQNATAVSLTRKTHSMYRHKHASARTLSHMHTHTHMHTRMHVHTHTHTCTHTHTHTHQVLTFTAELPIMSGVRVRWYCNRHVAVEGIVQ